MISTVILIAAAVFAVLFLGLPYYQTYKRRQRLERSERARKREQEKPDADSKPPGP